MAFTQSFAASATSIPQQLVITDTSIGSDPNIADRQIFLFQANGLQLIPVTDFPLAAGSQITLSPFSQDYAVNIIINWNNSLGQILYQSTQLYVSNQFGLLFNYTLTQKLASAPNIAYDRDWYNNKMKLIALIDSSIQAISVGSDLAGSQGCVNLYTYMIQNQQLYWF